MTEEQRMKKIIKDRLSKRPKIKVYCILCGEYCTTVSEQRELIHFDCYIKWKKTRQKPQ